MLLVRSLPCHRWAENMLVLNVTLQTTVRQSVESRELNFFFLRRISTFTWCSAYFSFLFFHPVCMFQCNLLTVSSKSLLFLTAEQMKVGERKVWCTSRVFNAVNRSGNYYWRQVVDPHSSPSVQINFYPPSSLMKVFSMCRSSPHLHTAYRTTFRD